MKNLLFSDSRKLTLTAPSGGVVSGTPVLIGGIFGVPVASAAEGELFALERGGVIEGAKATGAGTDWAEGDRIFWNSSTGVFTKTSAQGLFPVGNAQAAAATTDAVGAIALDGVHVTAVP